MDSYSFKATLNNIKPLIISLKAIASSQNYNTNCLISDYGIKFSIQNSSAVEARAYIQKSYFQDYSLQINQLEEDIEAIEETQKNININYDNYNSKIIEGDNEFSNNNLNNSNKNSEIVFSLNINTLLDCLTIFGGFQLNSTNSIKTSKSDRNPNSDINIIDTSKSKTTLRMECKSSTGRLDLLLEDNGVITICKLNTFEFNETSEIEAMLNQYPLINQLILNSKWLNEAFATIDNTCEEITIRISQEAPYFEITATNVSGTTKIEYSKNPEVIETFNCNATSIFSYKYSLLTNMFKALALSTKTQIKTNSKGVLQFQFMIPTIDTMVCFVDYIIIPSIE